MQFIHFEKCTYAFVRNRFAMAALCYIVLHMSHDWVFHLNFKLYTFCKVYTIILAICEEFRPHTIERYVLYIGSPYILDFF